MMTNAELALLGLIIECPRHGYEIEQVIKERGMREWTEVAFSSIYYILRKLERKELIESQLDKGPGKGPARKVYTITEPGMKAWYEATVEALSKPYRGSDPFLMGLAGLPAIPPDQAVAALRRHRDKLQERRDHVSQRWRAAGEHLPLFLDGMFDFSISVLQARMEWIEAFIVRVEDRVGGNDSSHQVKDFDGTPQGETTS
jgi:DNA-binding PadR family transcriptional regulator